MAAQVSGSQRRDFSSAGAPGGALQPTASRDQGVSGVDGCW